jgi:hypothetical protein
MIAVKGFKISLRPTVDDSIDALAAFRNTIGVVTAVSSRVQPWVGCAPAVSRLISGSIIIYAGRQITTDPALRRRILFLGYIFVAWGVAEIAARFFLHSAKTAALAVVGGVGLIGGGLIALGGYLLKKALEAHEKDPSRSNKLKIAAAAMILIQGLLLVAAIAFTGGFGLIPLAVLPAFLPSFCIISSAKVLTVLFLSISMIAVLAALLNLGYLNRLSTNVS